MKSLDLYLLRRYLSSLSLAIVSLLLIAIVVDLIESIDIFIDFETDSEQIFAYYVYHSPYWIILTLPIATLLGVLFAFSGLARSHEITAMKAAGISLYRILAPVFLFSAWFSLLAFLFTDRVVPQATYRYNRVLDEIRAYKSRDGSRKHVLLQDNDGQFVFARSYDNGRAFNISWEWRPSVKVAERVIARHLEWRGDNWVALDGTRYVFTRGQPPISSTFDTLVMDRLTLRPIDFARQHRKAEELSYTELRAYINRANNNGEDVTRHLVDLHLKISFPITCFIIVVLGAPLAANARKTGLANNFGLGILICFAFYSTVKAGQALGWNKMLDPLLGAWIANICFGLLSLLLLWRAHK